MNQPADSSITLFLALGLLLVAARVAGTITRGLGQPRVLGELLAGVILGPTLLDLLHSSTLGLNNEAINQTIHQIAQIGVLLLMFNVGMEVHLGELAKVGRVAGLAGISGSLLSVALTMVLILIGGYSWQSALFTGVALAATSVSISAQVLLELGFLRSKVGNALLGAALTDDIAGILLLSLAIAITSTGKSIDLQSLIGVIVRMVAYIGLAFVFAWFALPRLLNWLNNRSGWASSFGIPIFALTLIFLFGWSADHFGGVASITGAFIAGIGISRVQANVRHQIETSVTNLAFGFLVPIFFLSIGLQINLRVIPLSVLPVAIGLLVIAVGGKLIGCGGGARVAGFSQREAIQLGTCMIPRGEVSLIAAAAGISSGVFSANDPLFLSLFLIIILTALLTPLMVRAAFRIQSKPAPVVIVKGS